jgi:hypothetical protein
MQQEGKRCPAPFDLPNFLVHARAGKDRVGDVAADFGFGEEAGEAGFFLPPLGVVVAVDDEERVTWFAEEAEEPRGMR